MVRGRRRALAQIRLGIVLEVLQTANGWLSALVTPSQQVSSQ
jgi:hypothetical protein